VLIEAFIVLVMVAGGIVAYRMRRSRLGLTSGWRLDWRDLFNWPRKPAGARPGQPYVPDAGELTRIIVRGMVRLGFQSFTAPTRVLDSHVLVTGSEVDIDTIRHFERETRAEIVAFVEDKGTRYRWALNAPPTFSYRVDPKVAPGTLVISRAPSAADAAAGPEPAHSLSGPPAPSPSWPAWYGPDETERAAPPAPAATTRDPVGYDSGGWVIGAPEHVASAAPVASVTPIRPGGRHLPGTRYVGGGRPGQGPDSGSVRLFRVGGGNIYHLKPGLNRLGRDSGSCDIVCAYDDAISSIHLEFHRTGTDVRVRDLDSLNGTRLNGHDLVGTQPLRHGDELCLGETKLRLVIGSLSLAPTHHLTSDP
jgi:FHA domain